MKFENLILAQQMNIIIDMAQLSVLGDELDYKNPQDPILKGTGLAAPIHLLRTQRQAISKMVGSNDGSLKEGAVLSFNQSFWPTKELKMKAVLAENHQFSENVSLDRFGLTSALKFKGDLVQGLIDAAAILLMFEELLEEDLGVATTLATLAIAAQKVKELDESVFDEYYLNLDISTKLGLIANQITGWSTSNHTNPKEFIVVADHSNRVVARRAVPLSNGHGHKLVVYLGKKGDDHIDICWQRGDEEEVLIKRYLPLNYDDDKMFVSEIADEIKRTVEGSDKYHDLQFKLEAFLQEFEVAAQGFHDHQTRLLHNREGGNDF